MTGLANNGATSSALQALFNSNHGTTTPSFANPNAPMSPATQTAPPAQSITGVGSYTPDWASLINNDAGLKAVESQVNAGNAMNQDQLNAELANAYETFGSNVDLASLAKSLGMTQSDLQNAITPDVQQLAKENTDAGLSTQARLQQQNKLATQQLLANLNKRGLLHSGEAGYQMDQLNTGYRQAQSDAYQKLLGYLQQYQQGYLSALNGNTTNLTNAISAAATRQAGLNQGSSGATAQLDHIDGAGNAVYRGPNGNFYNADGSPYHAAAPAPPAPAPAPALPPNLGNPNVGYQQGPRIPGRLLAA